MKKLAVAFLIMFFSVNTVFAGSVKKLKGAPVGVPVYLFDNQIFYAKGACGFLGFSQEPSNAGAKIYDLQTSRVKNLQLNEPVYAYGKRSFIPIKLDNSEILIIGGNYFNKPTKEADIFDVKTGKFRKIGDTNFYHSKNFTKIIKLDDGEIFILNGQNIEIFDPKTETFIIPSKGHTAKAAGALHKYKGPDYIKGTSKAIKLSDDRIFIIGKTTSNLTKAEILTQKQIRLFLWMYRTIFLTMLAYY